MNLSAGPGSDVPADVPTVISTVPVPGGLVAVMLVSELTVKCWALALPKFTCVAPVNPLPPMTMVSPPPSAPVSGETPVTEGPGPLTEESEKDGVGEAEEGATGPLMPGVGPLDDDVAAHSGGTGSPPTP